MSEQPEFTQEQISTLWAEHKKIAEILKDHQNELRNHYSYRDNAEGVQRLLAHYRNLAEDSVVSVRNFRDDLLIWLRAMAMIVEMAGNAATHGEKNARLRGVSDLIESTLNKLHDHDFNAQWSRHYWRSDDIFRSDYPVKQYLDRTHEAERKKAESEATAERLKKAIAMLPSDVQTALYSNVGALEAEEEAAKGSNGHSADYIPF